MAKIKRGMVGGATAGHTSQLSTTVNCCFGDQTPAKAYYSRAI